MAKKWEKVRDCRFGGKKTGVVLANTQTGEQRTLLNSHGKYKKYQLELREGIKYTNDGQIKRNKKGEPIKLRDAEISYRNGYDAALIDQAKAFNAKNGGKK